MLSIDFIKHFMSDNASIIYLLIIVGMIIEGEIVVILAGIFAHLGSIHIFPIFLFIIIGGIIKSFLGYFIGYYLQKNHSHRKFLHQTEKRINYLLPSFLKKPFISIFLSRFLILGIHWFSLIFAGYKKIDLRIYIKAEIYSLVAWSIVMLSIGFFFSLTALSLSRNIRNFFGIIIIGFIVFFILEKIISFLIKLFEKEQSLQ